MNGEEVEDVEKFSYLRTTVYEEGRGQTRLDTHRTALW